MLTSFLIKYSPQQKLTFKISIDGKAETEEGILFSEATFIS